MFFEDDINGIKCHTKKRFAISNSFYVFLL